MPLLKKPLAACLVAILLGAASAAPPSWKDASQAAGLSGHSASRVKFADVNGDFRPDAILLPNDRKTASPLVFLNSASDHPSFDRFDNHGLPELRNGDLLAFSDLDNDGVLDAILGRYLDIYQDDYSPPSQAPLRTAWFPGKGDGSFGDPITIEAATLGTICSIAVNDINRDGLPDLFLGNWYRRYFTGYEAFSNDVLLQYSNDNAKPSFARWPLPRESEPTDYESDTGGRPTYGTGIVDLDTGLPYLLELNYGRRWNRLYQLTEPARLLKPDSPEASWQERPFAQLREPAAQAQHLLRQLSGHDIAAEAGVDGDAIRHGRHPDWPEELTAHRPRAKRNDEPPFRANGNTFDLAMGDIDNDGDFDLFFSTIIHAWAGESSDKSRFLVNQLNETGQLRFESFERLSVDRLPRDPAPGQPLEPRHTTEQNQGDIFASLADLNHDGRLDLVLCSSDYADQPPHDERLRIFHQQDDGRFLDVTHALGIDHIGAGMPSLADVDLDGDLDLLVGQSFNRLPREMRRQAALASGALASDSPVDATPERRVRLFLNESTEGRASITLYLEGSPSNGISQDAAGTIVELVADLDGDKETPNAHQLRQQHGPAGHAAKQNCFSLHFGLGNATQAERIEVRWPNGKTTTLVNVAAGRYRLTYENESLTKF